MQRQTGTTLLMVLVVGCTDQKPEMIGPSADQLASVPFAIGAGNHQWLTVGDTTAPLTVKARATNGSPESGRNVAWVVLADGASITSASDTTDSAGRATARVTLGPQTGTQAVLAISGTDTLRFELVGRDDEILQSDGNDQYSCELTVDSIGFCWGEGPLGRDSIGNWKEGPSGKPYHLFRSQHFALLARGEDHACALTARGAAFCWGAGIGLGTGDTTSVAAPTAVIGGVRFVSLAAGSGYTCGIDASGQAWCWGRPGDHLGLGGTVPLTVPTRTMPNNHFIRLMASDSTTCGITRQHALLCWGRDLMSQTSSRVAAAIQPSIRFTRVSVSHYHACAIALEGNAYCWGVNKWGDLGAGISDTTATGFLEVAGNYKWTAVGVGDLFSCGLTSLGTVYCWGYDRAGRLGDGGVARCGGNTTCSTTPIRLAGYFSDYTRIALGKAHGCAVRATSQMFCWGANEFGQLGIGGITGPMRGPVLVVGNHPWR